MLKSPKEKAIDPAQAPLPESNPLPELVEADDVGMGYKMSHAVSEFKKKEDPAILLDGPVEWIDKPTLADQIKKPGLYRIEKYQVIIFDLSTELQKYNEFLEKTSQPDTNTVIIHKNEKFDKHTGNWKVFVDYAVVKFKKISKGRDPSMTVGVASS
jgi:hypothetical protein